MPQTCTQLHYHLVYSTKNRVPAIDPAWMPRLWQYLGGIVASEGGIPLEIGGVADHVPMLVTLVPRLSLPDLLQRVKGHSSGWIHGTFTSDFEWQPGYGAFTVSHSELEKVRAYIRNQEDHHRTRTFEEEYRFLLAKHGIEYEERYLWE